MTLSSDETCASCRWRLVNPQNVAENVCRRFPPTAHVIPSQDRMGRMVPGFIAQYPPVTMAMPACGEYMPTAKMVS